MLDAGGAERLREHVARWIEFIGSLWSWSERAAFCLRYVGSAGEVDAALLAKVTDPKDEALLASTLHALLRSHRILVDPGAALIPDPTRSKWMPPGPAGTLIEVHQQKNTTICQTDGLKKKIRERLPDLADSFLNAPPLVIPWRGPGGPFLLPMECLATSPYPLILSVYLQPTMLQEFEAKVLREMAAAAESVAEQVAGGHRTGAGGLRTADPVSRLVSHALESSLRRLSTHPFLIAVHCAASRADSGPAQDLAGGMRALVFEQPVDRRHDVEDQLACGADEVILRSPAEGTDSTMLPQFRELAFTLQPSKVDPLCRLPYLADAAGAATMFRLPVSVRGGVPGMEVRQLPPDFNPGRRLTIQEAKCSKDANGKPVRNIVLGRLHQGGWASVPVDDLTKHMLITGFTGSGKSQTIWFLLHQLWTLKPDPSKAEETQPTRNRSFASPESPGNPKDAKGGGIPFLVIESAKQEYRGFLGVTEIAKDLRVFTLGNETCAPFRLNPFHLQEGVRVESHISRLQACFEGALPMWGPLQSVLIEALVRTYDDKKWGLHRRWRLTETYTKKETSLGRLFPTMSEFYSMIEKVIGERKYQGEAHSNVLAAITGRIKPLTMLVPTSVSRMLDTQKSVDLHDLFTHPAVLELNDLNDQAKSLIMMFLLTMLREYREGHASERLVHVTVVEEAHNVLAESPSAQGGENTSDTRRQAVQFFCQMLTEIRALGEGLIIADQSPEKLAPDAMRNTNVQIAHQLRDSKDRDAVARALLMTEEQRDFVGKLRPGHAAVFYTGLERATFVKVPNYRDEKDPDMKLFGFSGAGFGKWNGNKPAPLTFMPNLVSKSTGKPGEPTAAEIAQRIQDHMVKLTQSQPEMPFGELCRDCYKKTSCLYREPVCKEMSHNPGDYLNAMKLQCLEDYRKAAQAHYSAKLASRTAKGDKVKNAALKKAEAHYWSASLTAQRRLRELALEISKRIGEGQKAGSARCAFLHLCYEASLTEEKEFLRPSCLDLLQRDLTHAKERGQ